jgi:hypothetical protein
VADLSVGEIVLTLVVVLLAITVFALREPRRD